MKDSESLVALDDNLVSFNEDNRQGCELDQNMLLPFNLELKLTLSEVLMEK